MILFLVFGKQLWTVEQDTKAVREFLEARDPRRKKLWYRIMNKVVEPMLIAMFTLLFWPMSVYSRLTRGRVLPLDLSSLEEAEFAVEKTHLQERLTLQQVEARERVVDPLSAVPDAAFGHLNAAWKTFIGGMQAEDEVWSFTAPWRTPWGSHEIRTGYVLMNGGVLGAHFLSMNKEVEKTPPAGEDHHLPESKASGEAKRADSRWRRKQAD